MTFEATPFGGMINNASVSLAMRAANLRQLAALARDEEVRQLLTDLADECDILANARQFSSESERLHPDWAEYQNTKLIPLGRAQSKAAEENRRAKRSDRNLMLLCYLALTVWGLILLLSLYLGIHTALRL